MTQHNLSFEARFALGYEKRGPTECWEWKKALSNGYGIFGVAPGKVEKAHRIAFKLYNGDIPAGREIMHLCNNPKCVNPQHLYAGTHAENMEHTGKLTVEQVAEIRRKGEYISSRKLGKLFGVSHTTIQRILNGARYQSHLEEWKQF